MKGLPVATHPLVVGWVGVGRLCGAVKRTSKVGPGREEGWEKHAGQGRVEGKTIESSLIERAAKIETKHV